MRGFVSAAVSALTIALFACSSGPPDVAPSGEPVGRAQSAIINGELDTTHQAVVAILAQEGAQSGLCSGTIIKVDPATKVGWVLTAAHCVEVRPVMVMQGDDIMSPTIVRYEVLDYAADSRYSGQTGSSYDFGMVRILGVDASTPTIPVVSSPDGLGAGTPVLSVGYGRTSLIDSGDTTENSLRRRVAKTLSQVGQTQIGYDMSTKGICQGDSGGPVLVQQGGVEKVAGIHSFVQGDCNGFGVSGRATAAATFIATELAKAPPPADCNTCEAIANSGNNECAVLTRACLADKDCSAFYQCVSQCGNTVDCRASCLKKYPKAEGPFSAATSCVCTRACATECGNGFSCKSLPKCGYKLPAGTCSTCTEGACCDETFECTADAACFSCLKTSDADPACATNPKRKALATCVASKCKDECAGSGLDNGADPPAEDPGAAAADPATTTTTTTTTSCAVASAGASSRDAAFLGAFAALGLVALRRRRRS